MKPLAVTWGPFGPWEEIVSDGGPTKPSAGTGGLIGPWEKNSFRRGANKALIVRWLHISGEHVHRTCSELAVKWRQKKGSKCKMVLIYADFFKNTFYFTWLFHKFWGSENWLNNLQLFGLQIHNSYKSLLLLKIWREGSTLLEFSIYMQIGRVVW